MSGKWTQQNIPDLTGKVITITDPWAYQDERSGVSVTAPDRYETVREIFRRARRDGLPGAEHC